MTNDFIAGFIIGGICAYLSILIGLYLYEN